MELSWPEAVVASVAIVSVAAVVISAIWQLFATGRAGMTATTRRENAAARGAEAAPGVGGADVDESHRPAQPGLGT